MSREKQHAATILPLVSELRKSKGFNEYLKPKIEERIQQHHDKVMNDDNITPEKREIHRQIHRELKDLLEGIDTDFQVNAKIMKEGSDS